MRLSPSFVLDEFECHSGEDVPEEYIDNVQRLCIDVLQPIRNRWGALVVVSGWRSKSWNTRVGGARNSTHLTGDGADVRPVRHRDIAEFHADILRMYKAGDLPGLGGLGQYRGWVHVDTRRAKDGHLRRWTGRGMGSEPNGE